MNDRSRTGRSSKKAGDVACIMPRNAHDCCPFTRCASHDPMRMDMYVLLLLELELELLVAYLLKVPEMIEVLLRLLVKQHILQ
mmetsp:Transcript_10797/g.25934  ORF Transcript_10797/g.25934 Transcript_10797/m.25934 type:complete len:83 (+) Transcript_10797:149-397(+)